MSSATRKIVWLSAVFCLISLASTPAYAFRCGNRIVIDGMRETDVRAFCGEPTHTRHVGYAIRAYFPKGRRNFGLLHASRYGYAPYQQEVMVTEHIYNFGPRKLIRILRFEGGILTHIETAGYGYHEDK
jgi:hypothetical protein